jgi:1,2-phenylacetyl-CoA epoxidase PaaB subunit
MNKYRVRLRSAPGMWEQYESTETVWADDEEGAFFIAVRSLVRRAFADRPNPSCWVMKSCELLVKSDPEAWE